MPARESSEVDVVIIGGGPAGATAARCLALQGRRVVLLEREPRTELKWGETCPPRFRFILNDLGLLDSFRRQEYPRMTGITVAWGSPLPSENDFLLQRDGCGWHIPRGPFDRWLREMASIAGSDVRSGVAVTGLVRTTNHWNVQTTSGNYKSTWIINAAGRAWGKKYSPCDPMHRMITMRLTLAVPASKRMVRPLVESAPTGWWFSVESPDRQVHVQFITDLDLLANRTPSLADWYELLEAAPHTAARLRLAVPIGTPILQSVNTGFSLPKADSRLVPVGDAVISMDPLASQGICFAVESAQAAATMILDNLRQDTQAEESYSDWCRDRLRQYLSDCEWFYSMENRWANIPFWSRHRGSVAAVAGAVDVS